MSGADLLWLRERIVTTALQLCHGMRDAEGVEVTLETLQAVCGAYEAAASAETRRSGE